MIDTPVQTIVAAQHVAAVHLHIPLAAMREEFPAAMEEIGQALQRQGIQPTGPVFAHHFRRPTDTFDFNVCLSVERAIVPAGRVQSIHLPALPVLQTTYRGDYASLPHAWPEFMATPQVQAASLRGDFLEAYLVGPHQGVPPSEWRTSLSIILTASENEEEARA